MKKLTQEQINTLKEIYNELEVGRTSLIEIADAVFTEEQIGEPEDKFSAAAWKIEKAQELIWRYIEKDVMK